MAINIVFRFSENTISFFYYLKRWVTQGCLSLLCTKRASCMGLSWSSSLHSCFWENRNLNFRKHNILQALFIWFGGLLVLLFHRKEKQYRLFGIMYILIIVLFLAGSAKSYYTLGIYPILFVFGACFCHCSKDKPSFYLQIITHRNKQLVLRFVISWHCIQVI